MTRWASCCGHSLWGEPGTQLENQAGPEDSQREQLVRIGERLREAGSEGCVVEEDTSAGHGVGKSAIVSWMILWSISTFENTRGVVTANTDTQLRTKTWAELAEMVRAVHCAAVLHADRDRALRGRRPDPREVVADRPDPLVQGALGAFAGLHNQGKRIIVIFYEASAIDDVIWEVTEGALTDVNTQILVAARPATPPRPPASSSRTARKASATPTRAFTRAP